MTQSLSPRHPLIRPHYCHLLHTPTQLPSAVPRLSLRLFNKKKVELEFKSAFLEFLLGTRPLEERRDWSGSSM